jgi:adenylate cyclase
VNPVICVVDDDPDVNQLLCALLQDQGYRIVSFKAATEFVTWCKGFSDQGLDPGCDLVISDISMPGMTGYDLCKTLRKIGSRHRIPVILITGSGSTAEKTAGIEAGADDFIEKPFHTRVLLAKAKSLLEIHASDLKNLSHINQLTRFVAPGIADLLTSEDNQALLKPHRADVTVMFVDLRRFTAFSEKFEPEEVLEVLGNYYTAVGDAALRHNGTLGHLAGDGIMVFFNDPLPVAKHQEVALRMSTEVRAALAKQRTTWQERRYDIDFGIGLAQGHASIGGIGFDRFWQYSVIGPVTNFASRLCHVADHGQILVSDRFLARMASNSCVSEPIGQVTLKGIEASVAVHNIVSIGSGVARAKPDNEAA